MKSNKSYLKRIKVTKTGKLVTRAKGQDHYNAKESGRTGIKKRRTVEVVLASHKAMGRFLPRTK